MADVKTITITLPLPPAECAPNSRAHWRARARQTKAYRAEFGWAARAALGQGPVPDRATVQATFYHAHIRRRDPDNLLASLKAAFDGLTDAGAWRDDARLTHLSVVQARDPARPRVEIQIIYGSDADTEKEERLYGEMLCGRV